MTQETAPSAPARFDRTRALLAAAGLAVLLAAAALLAEGVVPPLVRLVAAALALVAGVALLAVALRPLVAAPWIRPAFWAVVAAGVVPVAIAGDTGLRVPALLVGLLALAQCALGVVVWRRTRAAAD